MTTPMRSQYLALKKQFPDIILFFRLGDFYETFDDDAKIVSDVCSVVLTSRPIGNDVRVPLAGVPYHAVEGYVAKLINAGYKVAIAEQIGNEPPKGEKLVPRVVSRVVTPGTLVEPGLLPERANNYIAAVLTDKHAIGLAYADVSTGEFAVTELTDATGNPSRLSEELARLNVAELVFPAQDARWAALGPIEHEWLRELGDRTHLSPEAAWKFEYDTARQALLAHFGVSSLAGFGCDEMDAGVRAAGGLLQYLQETQRDSLAQLTGLRSYSTAEFMTLDPATRRSLELTETIRGGRSEGSLLGILDRTLTPMGGRLLRRWLSQPLLDITSLDRRLDDVEKWKSEPTLRTELRKILRNLGDLERWTNRVVQGIAQPRDLIGIRDALVRLAGANAVLRQFAPANQQDEPTEEIDSCEHVLQILRDAISDEPPATLSTPGVMRAGYSAELDGIHIATRDARAWIANLEGVERHRTGIKSLKVGFNKVFGYYIEVTRANEAGVPEEYIRKQTLVNAERYITPELKEYESLVLNAEERILELESELYRRILAQVSEEAKRLMLAADQLASLDVVSALADVADAYNYVRPQLIEDEIIEIRSGRHPVVERLLSGESFTPNDITLRPEQSIILLTGPNMSGKSTFIRQVAMIVLMAQIGSFVPAASARIGLVDRIFTRIGASDEISRGQSTFMVEMVETANILNHATQRSLLVLDEIGRGTSTYDGLAIAWAIVEYIHNNPELRAKTLFATHYHELTDLAERLPHVANYNVAVAEQGDSVVFLHRIVEGAADRSYGVHVARLAGMPRSVVRRAEEILADLEASGAAGPRRSAAAPTLHQLSLFSREDPIIADLRALDVNALSPLDALNKLFELQQRLK